MARKEFLYILPHQLFEPEYLRPVLDTLQTPTVVLWEHPDFFIKFKFNKKKLVLHRASMQYYHDNVIIPLLTEYENGECEYVPFSRTKHKVPRGAVCFDPINRIIALNNIKQFESPNFLLRKDQYDVLMKKHNSFKDKNINFTTHFYTFCKEQLKYLQKIPSQDKHNRNALRDNVAIPLLPFAVNAEEYVYVEEATSYVEKHFSKNYGTAEDFAYPISRERALGWLDDFMKKRLKGFGTYQDAIRHDDTHNVMFHSVLSSSMNIGLLHPMEVKNRLENQEGKAGLNDIEGFFRQLCWREYQRFCYIHLFKELNRTNFYGLRKRLTKKWYNGSLGVRPVDVCIKNAFENAYLHHIERLMVVGNFMVLSEIRPTDAHRWFMEFAIDSYEWVMLQNVYDMLYFGSGGRTSYKPYISSDNYVIKMSNYKRTDEGQLWSKMYKDFVVKHKKLLYKYRYHFPHI